MSTASTVLVVVLILLTLVIGFLVYCLRIQTLGNHELIDDLADECLSHSRTKTLYECRDGNLTIEETVEKTGYTKQQIDDKLRRMKVRNDRTLGLAHYYRSITELLGEEKRRIPDDIIKVCFEAGWSPQSCINNFQKKYS